MLIPHLSAKIDSRLSLLNQRLIKEKPLFLLRALSRSLCQRLFNLHKYRGAMFAIHYKCNLNCRHCYEKNFTKTDQQLLTSDEKRNIIDQCLSLGILAFDFIGGESHLDPQFEDLVRSCKPKKTYITLGTNGYDLTEEKIRHFLEIGVDKFNISIDSWYPHDHDDFRRKKGSHAHALRTLHLCRKIGMGVTVSVVVYKGYTKQPGFQKLVDFATENRIRLAFKLAVPLGQWEGNTNNLVTEEDKGIIQQLHLKYPFLTRDIYGNPYNSCPAFKDFFTITAYGDVLPCNAIHISFGNLRKDSLDSILNKARKVKMFSECYHGCPPAEDIDFIQNYLSKSFDARPYPIKAEYVFEELTENSYD